MTYTATEGKVTITNERSITVKGDCIITDPCYILGDYWSELCDLWFDPLSGAAGADKVSVVILGNMKMLVSRTTWGDGSYGVNGAGSFCVDAGLFCIVERAAMDAEGLIIPEGDWCWTSITFNKPTTVSADGKGAMHVNSKILVDTDAYDDDDYWDDDDD